MKSREGPDDSFQRYSADNHRVVPDVEIVIEADELMTNYLPVNRERGYGQRRRDQQLTPAKVSVIAWSRATLRGFPPWADRRQPDAAMFVFFIPPIFLATRISDDSH